MCGKIPQLSPFHLPTGAGTDKQKEEQCQPREEQRGMLQGPKEEPQSPTVDVEHDGQQQPDDVQGSHGPRKPQKCSFIGMCAKNPQGDARTAQSISRQKNYMCEDCGKLFSSGSKLTRHRRIHTGEKPFKCRDCGRGFTQKGNLLYHQRTHTKEKPFSSDHINLKCSHKGERPYPCSHCGKTFQHINNLWRHQEALNNGAGTDKQKEEQCQPREEQSGMLQGCEEEPQSPTVDVEHDGQQQPDDTQGSHRPREPQKSSLNGTCAEDPQEDTTQTWSSSREKEYKCEHCGKVFGWNSSLYHHRRTHTGEKPFKCLDCGKSFKESGHLLRHQRIHMEEKPYACNTCGRCFSNSSNLISHQRIHVEERPYLCLHCGMAFQQSDQLRKHQETLHYGTHGENLQEYTSQPRSSSREEYKCEDCGKVFTRSDVLTNHRRIHTGEKPYKCQDCGKSFTLSWYLLRHQTTHTEEKPYLCTTCGKRFSRRSYLIKHRRIHTGERPYACSHCEMTFRQNYGLRRHQRAVHRGTKHPAGAKTSTPGAGGEVGEQGGADTDGTRGCHEEHPCSHEQAGGPRQAGDL
uniref:C2H2-type domain-containing protein n=1 Tax=Otus sunia TaxID=257818 RepID=A0A8C8BEN0_9STRI